MLGLHSKDVNEVEIFICGIDDMMVDIDTAGIEASEISDAFFEGWR
jgi:hypothetical protein